MRISGGRNAGVRKPNMSPITSQNAITKWNEPQASQTLNTWKRLLILSPAEKYGGNITLFFQGDQVRELFILARGIVKLTCIFNDGQSYLTLRYPGQFIEECAYDLDMPSPASATTITPCDIHRIDITRIREAERRNAEVNAFEKCVLKRDLYNMGIARAELRQLAPAERLERLLWELATVLGGRKMEGAVQFVLPLNNFEMAGLLGLSESHYKQIRGELELTGRLRRLGRRAVVLFAHN